MPPKQISVDLTKELAAAIKALQPAVKRLATISRVDFTKLPVGSLADLLYDLRAARQQLGTITAPLDDLLAPAEKAVKEHFVNTLKADESSGVQGQYSRVQVTPNDIPVVKAENWLKFFAYVAKTKQWELLAHKISAEAVRERWNDKKQVKFVDVFHDKRVSCTKLQGKGR
jgi:hypothetical protein